MGDAVWEPACLSTVDDATHSVASIQTNSTKVNWRLFCRMRLATESTAHEFALAFSVQMCYVDVMPRMCRERDCVQSPSAQQNRLVSRSVRVSSCPTGRCSSKMRKNTIAYYVEKVRCGLGPRRGLTSEAATCFSTVLISALVIQLGPRGGNFEGVPNLSQLSVLCIGRKMASRPWNAMGKRCIGDGRSIYDTPTMSSATTDKSSACAHGMSVQTGVDTTGT